MDSRPARKPWRSLFVMALGAAIDNADGNIMTVLGVYIMKALQMDMLALGWVHAIGRLSRMVFGPLWAFAGDRFDRRILLFIVTGLWGIWTVLIGFVTTPGQFFVFYTIAAVGTVATEPLTTSVTADLFAEKERGKAFGVLRSVGYFVLIIFTPLAIFFTQYSDGWRWILFCLGGLSMVSGVLILVYLQDPGRGVTEETALPDEKFQRGDLKILLSTPSVWVLAGSQVLLTSVVGTQFFTLFLGSRHLGQTRANLVLAAYLIAFAVAVLIGGRLGDWAHRKAGFRGRIILMQAYLITYAATAGLCLMVPWSETALYFLFGIFGLVAGIGTPAAVLPLISAVVLPEVRSTAFGLLLSLVQGASLAVLSVVFPAVQAAFGWKSAFFTILILPYLANAGLWAVLYLTVPKDQQRVHDELIRRAELARGAPKA